MKTALTGGEIMDHFGIGAAMRGVANVYFRSARQSGRTISLIESVKSGDRIIFTNMKEADRVKRLCKEDGKDVKCIVVDPKTPERLLERGTNQQRTLFDHTWVEQYYLSAIERCERDIDYFQREMSGRGEAHRETRRRAAEVYKWNAGG